MYFMPESGLIFENHSDIRQAFPQTSFPSELTDDTLRSFGVFPVTKVVPLYDPITQGVRAAAPELTDKGHWEQRWEVYALDPDQVAANQQAAALRLRDEIVQATQQRLDDFARTRNYDNILSLCTYATSSVPKFQQEGQYGVTARDTTWAKLYEIFAEVEAGNRPMPTSYSDIEAELPELIWPN